MDEKRPKVERHGNAYIFNVEAISCPPGRKAQRLREDEPPSTRRWWLLLGGVALAALGVGVGVGRFLH